MRYVQVTVPDEKRREILGVLEAEGIDYVVTEATEESDYTAVVSFPLPTEAVEPVLSALNEYDIDRDGHSVVLAAETVVSRQFEEFQREYSESGELDDQVASEELRTQAREFVPSGHTYWLLSAVSAVVATAGTLVDSPAVVVGAMVIAPLVGPAIATSVGTVFGDQSLFRAGVNYQFLGFLLAILSATLSAFVARTLFLVPPSVDVAAIEQVAGRLAPNLLSLVVAVGAGIAGARSLTSDVPTALVGVMIAAALVPPGAAVGIGIAWWLPRVVFNAGLLVLVNALTINLAALATLWYSNYRPSEWVAEARARVTTRRRLVTLLVGVLVLAVVLGSFTAAAYQTAAATQAIQSDVEAVLDRPTYDQLAAIDTQVGYDEGLFGFTPVPERIVVSVARPDGGQYPALADRIERRIERRTGDQIVVQVRYVDVDSSE